ncbi:MAG: hypothetical protein ABR543_04115 [Gemmatimonadaceae bacterium]
MPLHRTRPGSALLEVMIALVILGFASSSILVLTSQSIRAVTQAREADERLRDASAFFDAVALWTRDDLDRHLGVRAQGPWSMRVVRSSPTLYVVSLADTGQTERREGGGDGRMILMTALFRPEPLR